MAEVFVSTEKEYGFKKLGGEQGMKNKSLTELYESCKPVLEYLRNNFNPHVSVVITGESIKVVETEISVPIEKCDDQLNKEKGGYKVKSEKTNLVEKQFAEEILRIIDVNELSQRQVEIAFNYVWETLKNIMIIPRRRSSSRREREEQGLKI